MANTSAVYARIDTNMKEEAERILESLGITPSSAIQMFYRQIIMRRGVPFSLNLPYAKPTAIGGMTQEEFDRELQKGVDSLETGRLYTAEEVATELKREFGI